MWFGCSKGTDRKKIFCLNVSKIYSKLKDDQQSIKTDGILDDVNVD